MRNALWPDVDRNQLWHRKTSDGWVTLPRAFPLILRIMDILAPNGKPVSSTYLDLWCRTFDDSFVVASKPRDMAFYAGFTGERAQHTWITRVRQLAELGFIRTAEGSTGPPTTSSCSTPTASSSTTSIRARSSRGSPTRSWNA